MLEDYICSMHRYLPRTLPQWYEYAYKPRLVLFLSVLSQVYGLSRITGRRPGTRGDLFSQQPHNAAPLQPVFCFPHPPTSDQYMCVGAPRKSDPTVHPAIDHGPSGQYQDSDSS